MSVTTLAHRLYVRRLKRQLTKTAALPRHVGVIMDGNRRWARSAGLAHPGLGHRYGADHIEDLLRWCDGMHIPHVTVFVCSAENLARREAEEIDVLMDVITTLADRVSSRSRPAWAVHTAGESDTLPVSVAAALKRAVASTETCDTGNHLTLAVGYSGRQEVVHAVRDLLLDRAAGGMGVQEIADQLTAQDIAGFLYNAGHPEPDLIIRTSGEQRLSNFLLWQSAYSELYFCDAYWPAFRETDFLRALRTFAGRERRFGG